MAIGLVGRQFVLLSLAYSVVVQVATENKIPGNCPLVDSMSCGTITVDGETHVAVPKLIIDENIHLPDIPELENTVTHRLICKVPACISNPCQNGASCTESLHGFDCSCAPEFYGLVCASRLCTEHWQVFEGSCYRLFLEEVNFDQALMNCRGIELEMGHVDLASIHSDYESAFILDLCQGLETCYRHWIGLHQPNPDVEGAFVWSDGSPYDYTSFGPNQPNNWNNVQDCVDTYRPDSTAHMTLWNDINCLTIRPYVCKVTFNT